MREELVALIKRARLSHAEVGALAGVTRQYVHMQTRGERRVTADVLGAARCLARARLVGVARALTTRATGMEESEEMTEVYVFDSAGRLLDLRSEATSPAATEVAIAEEKARQRLAGEHMAEAMNRRSGDSKSADSGKAPELNQPGVQTLSGGRGNALKVRVGARITQLQNRLEEGRGAEKAAGEGLARLLNAQAGGDEADVQGEVGEEAGGMDLREDELDRIEDEIARLQNCAAWLETRQPGEDVPGEFADLVT